MKTYTEECAELEENGGILKISGLILRYYKPNYILHRDDGPTLDLVDGTKHWHINGCRHREDGAAIEWCDGSKSWYYNGKYVMRTEGDVTPEQLLDFKLRIL